MGFKKGDRIGIAPPTKGKGRAVQWLRERVSYTGDECQVWPFSKTETGYGTLGVDGCHHKAHRFMCALAHGEQPTKRHQAAHACGNRACVNPRHLSWKTPSQNEADKKVHGTVGKPRGSRTKLSASDVAFIRSSKGKVSPEQLAVQFGLSRAGILYWRYSTHDPLPQGTSPEAIRRRARAASAKHPEGLLAGMEPK
jgi:hypothetical protein